jgi:hypothetical protein
MEEQDARKLLGRRIRALRLRRELTQEALGERAGLNYKYLGAVPARSTDRPGGGPEGPVAGPNDRQRVYSCDRRRG